MFILKVVINLLLLAFLFQLFPVSSLADNCGTAIKPLSFYNKISLYSLIVGFTLIFVGILSDKTRVKKFSFISSLIPFALWGYVHFYLDFMELKKNLFAYNAMAENTLANIAEAQDRYKSEQDTFLKDLQKLYSHTAGSHGVNPCVRILKIDANYNQWMAEAKHVSSPDVVRWDSDTGSSLKKG